MRKYVQQALRKYRTFAIIFAQWLSLMCEYETVGLSRHAQAALEDNLRENWSRNDWLLGLHSGIDNPAMTEKIRIDD